uniref:CD80-like immunoglobulin C2-set domain-containing protein n=1 Tax=Sinocyclocheilus grahami TaxID=75366 RepID=A0A672QQT9_SINGR
LNLLYFNFQELHLISYHLADECIVGVIGERVILPCVYYGSENLTSLHISSEWRRGMEIIHTVVWMQGQVEMQNVSNGIRTTVSSFFHLKLLGKDKIFKATRLATLTFFSSLVSKHSFLDGEESRLFCNSLGGFPAPSIYWLVNYTQRPPETSVTTYMNTLPQSELYSISSVLSINISADTAISFMLRCPKAFIFLIINVSLAPCVVCCAFLCLSLTISLSG